MAFLSRIFRSAARDPDAANHAAQQAARDQEWQSCLDQDRMPSFVQRRLADTKSGKLPWVSTTSVGGLLAQRSHGIKPIGLVSGNCWYQYGFSWTRGHYDGWHKAIDRLWREAAALGANAVVDVTMKVQRMADTSSQMDYGVLGTAVSIAGLGESRNPVVATVSALEFARLMEAGIVPVGLAIGAHYQWYYPNQNMLGQNMSGLGMGMGMGMGSGMGMMSGWNQELTSLSEFLTEVRRTAVGQLQSDAARIGTGVLARVEYSEIVPGEEQEGVPPRYLARHIAFGTAVLHDPRHHVPMRLRSVFSVKDGKMTPEVDLTQEVI